MVKYEAIIDIDKFKKGDEVPEELAKVWEGMYAESPVKVKGTSKSKVEKPEVKSNSKSKKKGFFNK